MSDLIGQFTLSAGVAITRTTGNIGGYLRVQNNTPFQLDVLLSGLDHQTCQEFYVKDYPLPAQYQGYFIITPSVNISTVSHSQSNSLTLSLMARSEVTAPLDQALPQQAVTVTAAGKPIYTATVGFGATVSTNQWLNIFNPPNSGVSFTFHASKIFTNDTGNPTANLQYTTGADLNFGTAVPAVSHAGTAIPPVSFAHCTAKDSAVQGFTQTAIIETENMQQGITQDMLVFPDNITLTPGDNLTLQLSSGTTGHVVRLTLKWTEDIAIPPQGGVITGVATSIINEGNPLQNIIQATKQGDAVEDITITNAGTIVTKSTVTALQMLLAVGSISRVSVFTGSANNVGTLQAHGLGVKPDFAVFQETGTAGDTNTFSWDVAASDATNVKVWTNNATARTYIALAIKL